MLLNVYHLLYIACHQMQPYMLLVQMAMHHIRATTQLLPVLLLPPTPPPLLSPRHQVPPAIKHSWGRLLLVDTPALATTLGRNLSHALGVVHAGAAHTDIQAAVGQMLSPRVLSLGPLVPGRVGPVTDPQLREVVVKRQQVRG
jgi:hypothetical protein